ncbi:GNAT family N-acetyltransferase [Evansella sp. AB-rgal1]|uniref:GNAT family N-acetyltransferase n=1 Tax=Evansella sp. AB-rgal1 TaxID=3242696 RepID=UPI00359DBC4F
MNVLVTNRLQLREFTEADVPSLHAIFSDVETMKYYPAPFDYEKTVKWVERNQKRYIEDGHGLWAVCLKEMGQLIGDCGLVKQVVDGKMEVEIGYHINKNYWSKGYGTEAAHACKEYAFSNLGLHKVISIIDPWNIPSCRVAEKIGLTVEKAAWVFQKWHVIYSSYNRDSKEK